MLSFSGMLGGADFEVGNDLLQPDLSIILAALIVLHRCELSRRNGERVCCRNCCSFETLSRSCL